MVGCLLDIEGFDGLYLFFNYDIFVYDGIGVNEFVVDVIYEVFGLSGSFVLVVDFILMMNMVCVVEWNMWYYVLNCGFCIVVSGEIDFFCMSGEWVGIGWVYVKVDGELIFSKWV